MRMIFRKSAIFLLITGVFLLVLLFHTHLFQSILNRLDITSLLAVSFCAVSLATIPFVLARRMWLIGLSLLYQGLFFSLVSTYLNHFSNFHLLGYYALGLNPHSWFTWIVYKVPVLVLFFLPVIEILVLNWQNRANTLKKILCPLITTGLFFFAMTGFTERINYFNLKYDIDIPLHQIQSLTSDLILSDPIDLEQIQIALDWVHAHIQYEDSNPLRSLPDLLKNGKGTCGIQSKIFASLMRLHGIPIRYVVLDSYNRELGHTAVEVYLNWQWIYVDPQHRMLFFDENNHPLNAWDLHQNVNYSAKHPRGSSLFEDLMIFTEGVYFKVTEENAGWFYGFRKVITD